MSASSQDLRECFLLASPIYSVSFINNPKATSGKTYPSPFNRQILKTNPRNCFAHRQVTLAYQQFRKKKEISLGLIHKRNYRFTYWKGFSMDSFIKAHLRIQIARNINMMVKKGMAMHVRTVRIL